MTKEEVAELVKESSDTYHDAAIWFQVNNDLSVNFFGAVEFQFYDNITKLPYKIRKADKNIILESTVITTLENGPDECDKLYLKFIELENLDYLPKKATYINIGPHKIRDPYEFRKLLYVQNLQNVEISKALINSDTIRKILQKYLGIPERFHLAVEELMDLGESMGFTY